MWGNFYEQTGFLFGEKERKVVRDTPEKDEMADDPVI